MQNTLDRSLRGPCGPFLAGVLTKKHTFSPDLGDHVLPGDTLMCGPRSLPLSCLQVWPGRRNSHVAANQVPPSWKTTQALPSTAVPLTVMTGHPPAFVCLMQIGGLPIDTLVTVDVIGQAVTLWWRKVAVLRLALPAVSGRG